MSASPQKRISPWWRLVHFGFRLLYHELAWTYDAVAWLVSFGKWRAWGRTALPYLVGERVLELGHGPGHLIPSLRQHGFDPVGLDLSPQMGRRARRRLRQTGPSPPPRLQARAQQLPLAGATFDSVVATFPTPFIIQPATLVEVARVLRPGGRLVVVAGARLTGRDPLSRLLEGLYRITGQRNIPAGDAWLGPFEQARFSVRVISLGPSPTNPIGKSQVLLVLADLDT